MIRSLALALALALACPSSGARAQDDDAPADYQPLIDSAVAEFSAGRWPEARALFERAHATFPNARTLRGIGMSSFEMRDYPEAVRALESALASDVRALTSEQREQVQGLLARARALVGRFRMPAATAGARLYVDGAGASAGDAWPAGEGVLVLAVGRHDVSVRAEGRSAHAQIDVRGGEDAALDIDLSDLLPPSSVRREPEIDRRPIERPLRPAADDTPAWIVTGIGGGVAALGAALFAFGYADYEAVNGATEGSEWDQERASRAPILTGVGATLLGVGAAAAIGGALWGLLNDEGERPDAAARLRLDLGPGSLTLSGSF